MQSFQKQNFQAYQNCKDATAFEDAYGILRLAGLLKQNPAIGFPKGIKMFSYLASLLRNVLTFSIFDLYDDPCDFIQAYLRKVKHQQYLQNHSK